MPEPSDEAIIELTESVQQLTDHVRRLSESLGGPPAQPLTPSEVEARLARATRAARLRDQAGPPSQAAAE
jgi:hypothetical protein